MLFWKKIMNYTISQHSTPNYNNLRLLKNDIESLSMIQHSLMEMINTSNYDEEIMLENINKLDNIHKLLIEVHKHKIINNDEHQENALKYLQRNNEEHFKHNGRGGDISDDQHNIFMEFMNKHMYIPPRYFDNTPQNCQHLNMRVTDFNQEFISYCANNNKNIKINRNIITQLLLMFNEHPLIKNKYHEIKRWVMKDNKRYYSPIMIRKQILLKDHIICDTHNVNLHIPYSQQSTLSLPYTYSNTILKQISIYQTYLSPYHSPKDRIDDDMLIECLSKDKYQCPVNDVIFSECTTDYDEPQKIVPQFIKCTRYNKLMVGGPGRHVVLSYRGITPIVNNRDIHIYVSPHFDNNVKIRIKKINIKYLPYAQYYTIPATPCPGRFLPNTYADDDTFVIGQHMGMFSSSFISDVFMIDHLIYYKIRINSTQTRTCLLMPYHPFTLLVEHLKRACNVKYRFLSKINIDGRSYLIHMFPYESRTYDMCYCASYSTYYTEHNEQAELTIKQLLVFLDLFDLYGDIKIFEADIERNLIHIYSKNDRMVDVFSCNETIRTKVSNEISMLHIDAHVDRDISINNANRRIGVKLENNKHDQQLARNMIYTFGGYHEDINDVFLRAKVNQRQLINDVECRFNDILTLMSKTSGKNALHDIKLINYINLVKNKIQNTINKF